MRYARSILINAVILTCVILAMSGSMVWGAAGDVVWTFEKEGYTEYSPAIDDSGVIYIGSKNFYAINPDGTEKWKILDVGISSPAIGIDGTIYGAAGGFLYAFSQEGIELWKTYIYGGGSSFPTIGSDGIIYIGVGDSKFFAVNPDGTIKWQFQPDKGITSPCAIGSDGTIYVGSHDSYLYALEPDGSLKWKFLTDNAIYSAPAIDSDGTVYICANNSFLYAVNPDGTEKWKFNTESDLDDEGRDEASPVIGIDGTIYKCTRETYLYAINSDGSLKWKFTDGRYRVYCTPLIGSDGSIYAGNAAHYLYSLDQDGKLQWKINKTGWGSWSPATISNDGILYISGANEIGEDGTLYAIDTGTNAGLADSPWPKFQKDIGNTGSNQSASITAGEENLIAFSSDRDGNFEIYVMMPDGSGQTRLTNDPGTDTWPNWSPDNSEIAFVSNRTGNEEIYIMNADGTNVRNISQNSANEQYPVWSPDGSKIAFTSIREGNFDVFVMDADGSNVIRVTTDSSHDFTPSWSPDGTKIVYAADVGNAEIFVINADGSGKTNISNNGSPDYHPAWSPDGTEIAFHSHRGGNAQIYLMNPDGSNQRNITNTGSKDYVPAWTPDSVQLAFISDRDGNPEIYMMERDGSGQRNLTNNPAADWYPAWTKDSVAVTRSLTLTSPNGGENLKAGTTQNITWTADGFSDIRIELSDDNGISWYIIEYMADASAGSYALEIPKINTQQCLIRISDANDQSLSDQSDGTFGIDFQSAGLFKFISEETNASKWFGGDDRDGSKPRNLGAGQSIMLDKDYTAHSVGFEFDDKFDYNQNPENTGHEVTLHLNIFTSDGYFVDTTGKTISAEFAGGWINFLTNTELSGKQEYVFTCYVNGGETVELQSNILAHTDDKIPHGTGYTAEIDTAGEDFVDWSKWETHTWDFNFRLNGTYTNVSVERNLTLTSPNGGENWQAGTTQNITWTNMNMDKVMIQFSRDNGTNWDIIAQDYDANAGTFFWTVPNINSSECLIRVSDDLDTDVADISDGMFTITFPLDDSVYGTQITFSGMIKQWGTDWSSDDNWISYSEKGNDGYFDIWIVPSSGGEPVILTEDIEGSHSIAYFTPTENKLIFNKRGVDGTDIHGFNIHRINNFNIKENELLLDHAQNASMSNDSKFLVYRAVPSMDLNLWNIETDDIQRLGTEVEIEYPIQIFSHDDSHIITQKKINDGIKLFQIPVEGGQFKQLTSNEGDHWYHDISNNGNWILYTELPTRKIWAYNTISRNSIEVFPESPYQAQGAGFSSDGTQISYFRENTIGSGMYEVFVVNSPLSILNVTSPNGGEKWESGTSQNITWTNMNMDKVMIKFSSDGGATWEIIVQNYDANAGSYMWTVPSVTSSQCLIKISDDLDTDVADLSDGVFTIETSITPDAYITLTSPNGGEKWEPGTAYNIGWTFTGIDSVNIDLSVTNGNTWETIVAGIPGSPNSYPWTVPNINSSECLIRVSDVNDFNTFDTSDNTFTVSTVKFLRLVEPEGEETWPSNSTQLIQWISSNINTITIEYTPDNGATWSTVATSVDASTGSYEWLIHENPSTESKIRISDTADFNVRDESIYSFEISTDNFIDIVAPGPGEIWTVNSSKEILWGFNGVENVKIELSINDGVNWEELAESVQAFTGSYQITVPDTPSSLCRVRITDVSNPETFRISERFEIKQSSLSIYHVPVETAEELEELVFNTNISGTSDIESVTLFYRKAGEADFSYNQRMELSGAGSNDYAFTMETGYFTAPGMDYYIVAVDMDKNEARSPVDEGFYSITANILGIKSTDTTAGGTAQNAYRMISVPINFAETSVEDQLMGVLPNGTYGVDWRLFRYTPGSTEPSEYPDIEGFTPGNAYWFITKNDFQLNTTGGLTVTTSMPFNIALKQGWNDIGNPWLFDIAWDNIENPSGAQLSPLYSYNGTWSDPLNPPLTMVPWKGYAIYSYSNVNTIIKLKPETADGLAKPLVENAENAENEANEEFTDMDWMVTIKASAGDAGDVSNHLGVHPAAETEWDRYDHVEPPAIGDYVSVSFPHSDWEENPQSYTVDFRPPGNTLEWNFDVTTNIGGETVAVQLAGLNDIPDGYHTQIYDLDMNEMIDETHGSFSFVTGLSRNSGGDKISERHFRLVVTNDEFSEPEEFISKPQEFLTATVYPNPFNPQTTIQYKLSEPSKVSISVFNSVGQQVLRHDAGAKDAGTHSFIFNASELTTGTYFYRVETGPSTAAGKMLYMK
jgi:Tol biopolymer transport system component